jgi:multimeric flavodoxin WrbA
MRQLLIIYHSQSGNTAQMAESAREGALGEGITIIYKRAFDANIDDLLACDGLLLATPENFGYMSGALKDFFDRTYYPAEGKTNGRPFAILVSAGNDGSGAVREIGRIATGYGWKQVAEPIIARGGISAEILQRCRELGSAMASGIALGIF